MGESISTVKTGQRAERNAESISLRSTIVGSSRADKNRQKIKEEIENANPKFGFSGSTHESRPFGGTEKDTGFVEIPGGGTIAINHNAKGNNPYIKKDSYDIFLIQKNGNTTNHQQFNTEKDAIAAQKALYEKELTKVKKRYNL